MVNVWPVHLSAAPVSMPLTVLPASTVQVLLSPITTEPHFLFSVIRDAKLVKNLIPYPAQSVNMDTSWYLPPMLLSLTASHVLIVAELVSAHQTPQPVLHVSQDIS